MAILFHENELHWKLARWRQNHRHFVLRVSRPTFNCLQVVNHTGKSNVKVKVHAMWRPATKPAVNGRSHGRTGQWQRYARSWRILCPVTEKIGPGAGTCLWYFRWVRLPFWISHLPLFFWIFGLSFLSVQFSTSLNVRMLECNTEMPYLD